jgi:two-component system, NarL family, nitrate/nitrite response regulator NarL
MRCLLADDHPALVVALSDFLETNGIEVAAIARDGAEAVELAASEAPDVALVDYRMPKLAGRELVERIRAEVPGTKVVVYTAEMGESIAREALGAGASGIVLKEAPLVDVLRALESALADRTYVDPALAGLALLNPRSGGTLLTARECQVLELLAEGLSHEEIGGRLGISGETVRTHLQKASERLGAGTRTQAVATALRLGFIS